MRPGSNAGPSLPLVVWGESEVSTVGILEWVRTEASIIELREMREQCEEELRRRSYFCSVCGEQIPTALPLKHPAHAKTCLRYVSMVNY